MRSRWREENINKFYTKASNVLVEEIVDQDGHSVVEPVAVHQQDFLQKPELGEGEVCSSGCCPALLAHDAEPHVRLLDHGDVVAAVSHSCDDWFLGRVLHHLNNLCLL